VSVFCQNAQAYWDRGLPVIPLEHNQKLTYEKAWQKLASEMPTPETQTWWMQKYAGGGNIGLPLGSQSGLVAIDLDNPDPRIEAMLDKLLPPSPWTRIGKKGFVKIYKFSEGSRTFRIKDENNHTLIECLAGGAQVVLPPSIHPDTKLPYQANCNLLDVMDQAVPLPPNVEVLIRGGLIDLGYNLATQGFTKITAWVPVGSRDCTMIAVAGIESRGVVNGERTLAEAMSQMRTWVENYVEKVAGDPMDPEKAVERLLQFFVRDCTGPKRKPVRPGWELDLDPATYKMIKEQLGEEGEAWSYEKFMVQAEELFEKNPVGSPGYMGALNLLTMKMVNCSALNPLEEQMVCKFIVNCSGKTLTHATLRRQITEMRAGELEGINHTEIAEALLVELEQYGKVRYHNTRWWQWQGAYWRELVETEILRKCAETFGAYPAARRQGDHRGIVIIAATMRTGALEQRPVAGINFANGFLTTDMVLVDHDPDYGKTYVLPFRYMPEHAAHMPRFSQLLLDCWGADVDYADKVEALREAIAATLFGVATKFQKAICLIGPAGTGKSTIMKIMLGLMPAESWCTVRPQMWGDKFSPSAMFGKLLNFAGELSNDSMIPGDMFKLIIEGSEIEAQNKHQPLFRFAPRCAHWFASNHLPRSRDTSAGFTRRWLFLTFENPVATGLKITDLDVEILADEREAIAAWAVGSLTGLMQRHDYTLPKSHIDKISEVSTTNNGVRFFMQTAGRVKVVPKVAGVTAVRTSETTLFDAYWAFCNGVANVRPVSLRNFRSQMQELQGELGFKHYIGTGGSGMDEAFYECLTLAGVGGK
jgi:putative DNA primase/helicase